LGNQPWQFVEREGTRRELEAEDKKFYKSCIIDLLFTKDCEALEHVLIDPHEQMRRAESHNQNIWRYVSEKINREIADGRRTFPSATYEELSFEKLESYLSCFDVRID